jgi:hypothetical protein
MSAIFVRVWYEMICDRELSEEEAEELAKQQQIINHRSPQNVLKKIMGYHITLKILE